MERAFIEREFQTNFSVCVEIASYKNLMGVQIRYCSSLEFSGAAKNSNKQ